MKTQTVLRSTTYEDLLSLPGVCLGFHPGESVVIVGVGGCRVQFCLRADLPWLLEGLDRLVTQIQAAAAQVHELSLHVLAYSKDPQLWMSQVRGLANQLGDAVELVLIASPERYWELTPTAANPSAGLPWDAQASTLTASAVYHGVPIAPNREEALTELAPPADAECAAAEIRRAQRRLKRLSPRQCGERLDEYLDLASLTPAQAAEVAVMMQSSSLAEGMVARLGSPYNPTIRAHLAAARRCCPDWLAPNLLAVLALAYWFDLEGTKQTECIRQLQALDPAHHWLPFLTELHHRAIRPPRRG